MTDEQEEALFEVWFHQQRLASFNEVPDYGRFEDHPCWGMGAYGDMKKAWMARATLHVSMKRAAETQEVKHGE